MKKTSPRTLLLALITATIATLSTSASSNAAGNGWVSDGYPGTGHGGGGGGYCIAQGYAPACFGYSWVYYEYQQKGKYLDKDFYFPEADSVGDASLPLISKKCKTYGDHTGFWHYGGNAVSYQPSSYYNIGSTGYRYRVNGSVGVNTTPKNTFYSRENVGYDNAQLSNYLFYTAPYTALHWATYQTNGAGKDENTTNTSTAYSKRMYGKTLKHDLYQVINNTPIKMYSATNYAKYTSGNSGDQFNNVLIAFKKAYKAAGGGTWTDNYIPGGIYAFCSGSTIGDDDSNFTGSIKVSVGGAAKTSGETVTIDTESTNVVFEHTITRKNDGPEKNLDNSYYTTVIGGGKASGSSTKKNKVPIAKNKSAKVVTDSIPVSLERGESKTLKQTLHYDTVVTQDNKSKSTGSVDSSITIKRKLSAKFTPTQTCTVKVANNTTNECNSTRNTNSKSYTITQKSSVTSDFNKDYSEGISASTVDGGKPGFNKQSFGVNTKCARSKRPYTQFWWTYTDKTSGWTTGPTLAEKTNDKDTKNSCNNKLNWYTFDKKEQTKTWNNNILLGNNEQKVTVKKCSTLSVESTYEWKNTSPNDQEGSNRTVSEICNTIVRWRRFVNFSKGTSSIKVKTDDKTIDSAKDKTIATGNDGKFTVTFTYSVDRKGTDNAKDSGAENITVTNKWGSIETITAADRTGRTYPANGKYEAHDYGSFSSKNQNTNNVSGTKTETIKGQLYYGQKVKICGKVKYYKKVKETDDGSDLVGSIATDEVGCVTITRQDGVCEYNNKKFTHSNADNMARIGVINSSLSNSYTYSEWQISDTKEKSATPIYARPGDNIKYRIDYCMAASYAHSINQISGYSDNGNNATLQIKGNSATYESGDDTRLDNRQKNHYLFIDDVSTYNSSTKVTTPKTFTFAKSGGGVLINDDFMGSKQSPGEKRNDYKCNPSTGKTGYYQVWGAVKRKDSSATSDNYITSCGQSLTESFDVGRELSEKISFTKMGIRNGVVSQSVSGDNLAYSVSVRVPYNYTAKPYMKNNSSPTGVVQIGGTMRAAPGIVVSPRKNCALTGNSSCNDPKATYATVTKPTTVTIEAKLDKTRILKSDTYIIRANSDGDLKGGVTNLDNIEVDIPNDAQPGSKICITMSISPIDSHNNATGTANGAGDNEIALQESGEGSLPAEACSTVVKRPTVSIEDSNLYSAKGISTSIVERGAAGNRKLYGSWSEYGIFGIVNTATGTLGIASGAAFGYNPSSSYHKSGSNTLSVQTPQPLLIATYEDGPKKGTIRYNYKYINETTKQQHINYKYVKDTNGNNGHYEQYGDIEETTLIPEDYRSDVSSEPPINITGNHDYMESNPTVCAFSTQTFANTKCGELVKPEGSATNAIGREAAESYYDNIIDRYDESEECTDSEIGFNSGDIINATKIDSSDDDNSAYYKCAKEKIKLGMNGNPIDISTLSITNDGSGNTTSTQSVLVFRAKTIIINSDIIASNDLKKSPDDMKMPIIIADYVWITGTPKRIDAIIIAKKELNTCRWNTNDLSDNAKIDMSSLNSEVCTNELRFTAPVVVNGQLILNRTHGAGSGDDQTVRAEIFELNPATYLWSYSEMSRYNQAITTYLRELPTRY